MKNIYEEKGLYVENELAPALIGTGEIRGVDYCGDEEGETVTILLNSGHEIYVNVTWNSKWAIYKDVARRLLEVDI